MTKSHISRRRFIGGAAAAAATISIVPAHVLGGEGRVPPSEKINIAGIGVGGQGGADINETAKSPMANFVALCDVDTQRAGKTFDRFLNAKQFRDFREMLDVMDKQIDAVIVGTPDHTHAVAACAAMKRGKHVYCEKPMAHSIWEVRQMMKTARENKVITQLGNQGHSFDSIRTFCEWIWDGAIGNVREIHGACGSDYSAINRLARLQDKEEVPAGLDWNLWLGPVPFRPYHRMFVPGAWRGWLAFGTGVIGDWVCHVIDPVFWALDLGAPTTIQAQAKDYDPKAHFETCPRGTVIRYEFAAKGNRPAVTLYWHDGNEKIPRPEGLDASRTVPQTGAVVIGEKGGITYGSHGAGGLRVYPETQMRAYQKKLPPKKLPRGLEHHRDWLNAIRSGKPAGSDFTYGGPLTEIALLGIIAFRCLGQELKWDSANMRFTNSEEANKYLKPTFREGWSL